MFFYTRFFLLLLFSISHFVVQVSPLNYSGNCTSSRFSQLIKEQWKRMQYTLILLVDIHVCTFVLPGSQITLIIQHIRSSSVRTRWTKHRYRLRVIFWLKVYTCNFVFMGDLASVKILHVLLAVVVCMY